MKCILCFFDSSWRSDIFMHVAFRCTLPQLHHSICAWFYYAFTIVYPALPCLLIFFNIPCDALPCFHCALLCYAFTMVSFYKGRFKSCSQTFSILTLSSVSSSDLTSSTCLDLLYGARSCYTKLHKLKKQTYLIKSFIPFFLDKQ